MKFSAIVVGHADENGLRKMLGNLRYQTRTPDEVLVYACCTPLTRLAEEFGEATFHETEHRGDWGHADRAAGLAAATGDYVGFFNSDDSYSPWYIQTLFEAAQFWGHDVVYCDWNTYPAGCEFRLGSSTSGNFIVSAELARRVGYPATPVYENDGHFIDALAAEAKSVFHWPHVLYEHNVQ